MWDSHNLTWLENSNNCRLKNYGAKETSYNNVKSHKEFSAFTSQTAQLSHHKNNDRKNSGSVLSTRARLSIP